MTIEMILTMVAMIVLLLVIPFGLLIAIAAGLVAIGKGAVSIWNHLPVATRRILTNIGIVLAVIFVVIAGIVDLIAFVRDPGGWLNSTVDAIRKAFDFHPDCPMCF